MARLNSFQLNASVGRFHVRHTEPNGLPEEAFAQVNGARRQPRHA
jgi:hypothetical protein